MNMLTKLEELILLAVWKLGEGAYGTTIYRHLQSVTGKKLSLGGIYFPLDRLVKQGFLRVYSGPSTEERKGLSRRYYQLTEKGFEALHDIRRVNEIMWSGFGKSPYPSGGSG